MILRYFKVIQNGSGGEVKAALVVRREQMISADLLQEFSTFVQARK